MYTWRFYYKTCSLYNSVQLQFVSYYFVKNSIFYIVISCNIFVVQIIIINREHVSYRILLKVLFNNKSYISDSKKCF
jgi:hypothetical protein